jgi:hypothetical protein
MTLEKLDDWCKKCDGNGNPECLICVKNTFKDLLIKKPVGFNFKRD